MARKSTALGWILAALSLVASLPDDGKGAFAVKGRFATGTIGSARWTTTDTCKATTVKVARGKVRVGRRTARKGRSVTVRR